MGASGVGAHQIDPPRGVSNTVTGLLQYRWQQAKQWGSQHSASVHLDFETGGSHPLPAHPLGSNPLLDQAVGSEQHLQVAGSSSAIRRRLWGTQKGAATIAAAVAASSCAYYTRPDGPHFAAFVAKYLKRFAGPTAGEASEISSIGKSVWAMGMLAALSQSCQNSSKLKPCLSHASTGLHA